MNFAKRMDIVNVTALPLIPLDESLVVSVNSRIAQQNALRKQLQDNPPTCIIGSMSQVNQRITEIDLGPSLLTSTSAIEEYELEKKSLKEKTHGSPGDRVKQPKEESPISCKGSELRTAKLILSKRKIADKSLLAELYQYPNFDETRPNKLPNGVDFCDMVGNVVRSEKNPFSGKSFCSDRELEKFLSAPFLIAIWLDSFWWIFHERYQPNKEIQHKLFDRIARNYASLLFKMVRSHYEEALIRRLPSLLSKALYTSFCCCFPQSWFNTHEFKSEICNTMNLWISGTYPSPKSYDNWDYSELDPERFRREELILQSSRIIKGREFTLFTCMRTSLQKVETNKTKKFHPFLHTEGQPTSLKKSSSLSTTQEKGFSRNLILEENAQRSHVVKDHPVTTLFTRKATPQVKRISEVRACVSLFLKESHPACKSPKLTSNQFNLYGKSPLIVYYFLKYSKLQLHGQDLLISRRERTKVIPDSVMTYADIIHLVLKNMETRKKQLRQLDQLHESEWACFNNYLKELKENFEREVKIIDKKVAEKRKADHVFISPSLVFDDLSDKSRGQPHRQMAFLSRKNKNEVEEKQKLLRSPFSLESPVDHYSLGLQSPYRIGSISSPSEHISMMSKATQEMLFRLSPSSME